MPRQHQRITEFAAAWAQHAYATGAISSIREELYLDAAEPFVSKFLEERTSQAPEVPSGSGVATRPGTRTFRSAGGFRGVALLVGFEEDAVQAVAERIQAGGCGVPPPHWTDESLEDGWVVGLLPAASKVRMHACAPPLQRRRVGAPSHHASAQHLPNTPPPRLSYNPSLL
jgi:hypothetical protein